MEFNKYLEEVQKRLETRALEIRDLTAQLAVCKRERTQQAQYAVKLEDELNELKEEREFFIDVLHHLASPMHANLCTHEIHQKVRPYLQ